MEKSYSAPEVKIMSFAATDVLALSSDDDFGADWNDEEENP